MFSPRGMRGGISPQRTVLFCSQVLNLPRNEKQLSGLDQRPGPRLVCWPGMLHVDSAESWARPRQSRAEQRGAWRPEGPPLPGCVGAGVGAEPGRPSRSRGSSRTSLAAWTCPGNPARRGARPHPLPRPCSHLLPELVPRGPQSLLSEMSCGGAATTLSGCAV